MVKVVEQVYVVRVLLVYTEKINLDYFEVFEELEEI